MACECFDIGVIGEGEITFLELVKLIEKSGLEYLEDTKGIAYRKDGNVILAEGRDFINDLNELPFPARHLLPSLSRYSPFIASYRKLPIVHIISSRGCPMGCSFCDQAVFGSGYRSRSADNILDEVELVKNKFGVKEIRFYDDVFTLDKKRVFEMCDKIRERNITISWTCFAVVNTISKELLKKMKGAGCWQISFGLESGDEGVLKYLKTDISLEQNEMAVRLAQEAGLSVRAHFVIGSPWETKESLRNTLNFAKRFNIDYAHFIKFMPYPGSKIYNILIKQGYRYDFTKRFSTLNNSDVMYVPESLTKQEFINFLGLARREFYFRPSYILRKIISIRTWNEFIRNIFSFFAIRNFNRP
ncbi:MAG: radical SAM protein [Candidatus Omnitrophica bacterium]|nr:radical SAM protein [Candidatus Omnitrophota bacterium]